MNRTCKAFCLLLGLAIASFALPSSADNGKQTFSVTMDIVASPPAAAPPPFTVMATILNEGNSTINSFQLLVGGMTVVGVTQPSSGKATFTPASVSVKNMSPLKSGQSITVTIAMNSCGDGQWSGVAWTGSQLNGQPFNLDPSSKLATSISCGSFAAGDGFNVPDILNPDCVTGERGYYDKDGTVFGHGLPIYVTNTVPTNGKLHFRWPDFQGDVHDALATFEYEVCASGPLPSPGTTKVAWLNTDKSPASTPGTPAFIVAQDCLDNADFLPEPYAKLVSDDGATITVDLTQPTGDHPAIPQPPTPFDIVIESERLTVTAIACSDAGHDDAGVDPFECGENEGGPPNIWYVTRGVGHTTPVTHTGTPLVMSTPLPLLPDDVDAPYVGGSPALMCIADQDPSGEEDEEEDEVVTGHTTTFIDIGGDGYIGGP